jgi:hypothetical protein
VWDFNSSFSLTRAIVEEARIEIDNYHNTTETKAFYGGHYYTTISPGISILLTPIYSFSRLLFGSIYILEFIMVISSNTICGALSISVVYKISYFFTKNEKCRILTSLSYGSATSVFPYSLGLYPYIPAIFFILLAFYFFLLGKNHKEKRLKNYLLSGIFSGVSFIMYYATILILFLFLIFSIFRRERKMTIFFMIGTLPSIFLIISYTYTIFNYFEPIIYKISLYKLGKSMAWEPPKQEFIKILPRVLFYPWNGIFFYYPILLLCFMGIIIICIEKKLEGYFILTVFIMLVFFTHILVEERWWGDFSFGPRRLLLSIPFLSFGLPYILERIRIEFFYIFFIFSFFVNLLGLQKWLSLECYLTKEEYIEKIESFKPFGNPLIDYYLQNFVKTGPRSPLIENLIFKKQINIRIS